MANLIILPPDLFQMSMRDRLTNARNYIQNVAGAAIGLGFEKKDILVKYRTGLQKKNFPTKLNFVIEYGGLLELCTKETVVVGPPGSAMLECLNNEINFQIFWDYDLYLPNRYIDRNSLVRLQQVVYMANTIDELKEGMIRGSSFLPGKNIYDLLHQSGKSLEEVVAEILQKIS